MSTTLYYGNGASCRLELDGMTRVGPAPHVPIDAADLAECVRAALQAPLGYPPLAAATVPGDRVVVALEPGLPLVRELVEGVSRALRDSGVDPSLATFLFCQDPKEPASAFGQWATDHHWNVELHDPCDEKHCALFGVSQAGNALRLNRKLCDADIVLPIGVTNVGFSAVDDRSKFSGLFPQFSDEETIARHRRPEGTKPGTSRKDRRQEIDEAGWQLGVGMTVQMVPGPGDSAAAVFAGEPGVVAESATAKYRDVWRRSVDDAGDLLIATVAGAAAEQSWENIGRALLAADEVLEPGGAIAICSELAESPGPSLLRLANNDENERLERKLERDSLADSRTALAVCRALQRGPVYLHSQLHADLVESLGFAPIASEAELVRLAKSFRRPLVLEDAHRLLPVLTRQSP